MKKLAVSVLVSLLSTTAFAQGDITQKISEIDAEIAKIKKYEADGVSSSILRQQLQMLEKERTEYTRLQKSERKSKRKTSTALAEPTDKKFPRVLKKDLQELKHYQDETIPLEKRYDLILGELQNMYEINEKLSSLPDGERNANVVSLIESNRAKIKALEEMKNKYEILLHEKEQKDLEEMKKTGFRIGGMFDFYYQWAFNNPKRVGNNGAEIPYRNYTNRHNDFTLNLAEINVYKSYKSLDFYADIDFGEQAEQNESLGADGITHHLGQAFLRYRPKEFANVAFTAGKFYSHYGYEVSKNIENRTYSRPFYFTLACPFWHEGIAMTQSGIMEKFGYGLYVYDKTDDRVDNDSDKTYGFQLNYSSDKVLAVYNIISGSEQNDTSAQTDLDSDGSKKTMHEIIVTYNATEKLALVLDVVAGNQQNFDSATGKDSRWFGVVGYADFKTSTRNNLNFRYENFRDQTPKGAASTLFYNAPSATGNNVEAPTVDAYTVTNRYSFGNGSEVRLEYRFDAATKEIFADKNGEYAKTQSTLAIGWLYSI
jgi:hypothetical protein